MGLFSTDNPGAFAFGLLGNITSFVVFLAPIPTFIRVCKKKSTEGFQSFPYLVSLFSASILLYYATLKTDGFFLMTINSFGCFIETIYIALFIVYAPKQARMSTLRILLLFDFGGFCLILLLSHFLAKGPSARIQMLGWVNVVFSFAVFAAPLSIMRVVIKTKSVEFLPFPLSFFLTLSAIMWLFYGILVKDLYIAGPNVLGFLCGVVQMILFVIYRNHKPATVAKDPELQQNSVDDIKLESITCEMQEAVCSAQQQQQLQPNRNDVNNEENMAMANIGGTGGQLIACHA
ncbi:hypothetical protein JCGZ_26403 [Jatropha curcas]|uniref:Bidirectional sugar transporter SWEET n=1 Tax=Jatropha curcas TaxID=180498 RepID=A0A067JFF4_JATCU|nr:bidirectional sugar transporter SWEET12 [Jatropha curcas]KDP22572.1 hypothetical protein JCGZ_26403 [Jatropha curcas]